MIKRPGPGLDLSADDPAFAGIEADFETIEYESRGEVLVAVRGVHVVVAGGMPLDSEVFEAMDSAEAVICF